MKVGLGMLLAIGLLAFALPNQARAMEFHLLDSSLTAQDVAPASAASNDFQLRLDDGSGGGASMSPWIPWVASFIIPGLGQVINGQILKGVGFFVGDGLLFGIGSGLSSPNVDGSASSLAAVGLVFDLVGVAVWVWNWWDAYSVAKGAGGSGGDLAPAPVAAPAVDSAVDVASRRAHPLAPAVQASVLALQF